MLNTNISSSIENIRVIFFTSRGEWRTYKEGLMANVTVVVKPKAEAKIHQLDDKSRRKVLAARASIENGAIARYKEHEEFAVYGTNLVLVCECTMENRVQIVEIIDLGEQKT